MKESLHYLLMADHLIFQKTLLARIKDTGLTSGQPKVLDYLRDHDGAVQKEIAAACHIDPATLTSVLQGMENKDLIMRKTLHGNRRSLYVYLTGKGRELAERIGSEFDRIEKEAFGKFNREEKETLLILLAKINENFNAEGERSDD